MSVPNTEAVRDWANAKFEKKAEGKGLSTNDYTNEDKALVDKIPVEMKATSEVSGIKSGILEDSADGKIAAINLYGHTHKSKNLIKDLIPSKTLNGITLTNNGDGTYTLNGTATANTYFNSGSFELKDGTYKLIVMNAPIVNKVYGFLNAVKLDGSSEYNVAIEPNKRTFVADSTKYKSYNPGFAVQSGETVNNLLVKLMLTTDLDATYDDYEPYGLIIPSGSIKTKNKNIVKLPFNQNSGTTQAGITFTYGNDGIIHCNGKPTGDAYLLINEPLQLDFNKKYILSGNSSNWSNEWGVSLFIRILKKDGTNSYIFNNTDGDTLADFSPYDIERCALYLRVSNKNVSDTLDNYEVKPMIRPLEADNEYIIGESSSINAKSIVSDFNLVEVNGLRNEIHVFADGTGEKIERVGKKVFVGTESWGMSGSVSGRMYCANTYLTKKENALCSDAILGNQGTTTVGEFYINTNDGFMNIVTSFDSANDFKQHLATNPMTVIYELDTPTITPLTASEVSAFLALQTYSNYTSIESDAEIDLTYYANSEIGQAIADVDSKVDDTSVLVNGIYQDGFTSNNLYRCDKTRISGNAPAKIEILDTGLRVYSTSDGSYRSTYLSMDNLIDGKVYTLSADVTIAKGVGNMATRKDGGIIVSTTGNITSNGHYSLTFTKTGEMKYISLFCTFVSSEAGDVTYTNLMLVEGSEEKPYTKWSKSNVELTNTLSDVESRGFYSKNLLGKVTGKEMTIKGITITFLDDGTYKFNGTHDGSSGNAVFEIIANSNPLILENGKKYRVVGCPNGGSESTYNINVNLSNVVTNTYVRTMGKDIGNGFNFTINSDTERGLGLYIAFLPNQTANDMIFKPMLVDADLYPNVTYNDYEPYVKNNRELDKILLPTSMTFGLGSGPLFGLMGYTTTKDRAHFHIPVPIGYTKATCEFDRNKTVIVNSTRDGSYISGVKVTELSDMQIKNGVLRFKPVFDKELKYQNDCISVTSDTTDQGIPMTFTFSN